MLRYSLRLLLSQRPRLTLTVSGVELCVVLMLFLLGIYRGVADGSVEYIRNTQTDLWVVQENTTNILRGFSILSRVHGELLKDIGEVESISPLLFLLSTIKTGNHTSSVFLAGFDQTSGVGAPPHLISGRNILDEKEIVLDICLAKKFHIKPGDYVTIRDEIYEVVGLSEGTNMFVIQYGFASLSDVQSQLGLPGVVSCYLVKLKKEVSIIDICSKIKEEIPGIEAYTQEEFLTNNIKEMQSGFLPLLYTIAGIGGIVLTTILSLILSINILERRKDFAILKTIGSPKIFLSGLIISQSFMISILGLVSAALIFFPFVNGIEWLAPDVNTKSSVVDVFIIVGAVGMMSLISSYFSLRRMRSIYPTEAFV